MLLLFIGMNIFVCAYDLNAQTKEMKSYSCIGGNLENPTGKNPVKIGSGPVVTLSTGPFKPLTGCGNKECNYCSLDKKSCW